MRNVFKKIYDWYNKLRNPSVICEQKGHKWGRWFPSPWNDCIALRYCERCRKQDVK